MSSSGQNGHVQSTRHNPRRRVRATEDSGSVRQQPQRKRSKIDPDTFIDTTTNGQANGTASQPKLMNGHLPSPGPSDHSAPSPHPVEMPHRTQSQPAAVKSREYNDGTTTLTSNPNYEVQKLPGLPSVIRNNKGNAFRGAQLSSHGYALVLTRQHALIWDYTSSAPAPPTRSLNLPHPTKSDEAVSLGAFVSSGANNDTGLVVVNPTNGKISFWESIENADALSLFEQRRNGVEGSCGGLQYGETVSEIVDAGSAGFVLSFSSGRTAQLLVRDAQSRPCISTNFLRKVGSGSSFLSTIKNVFGAGGWLRNVASVQTRASSTRGQTDAILCSEDAMIQIWQLNWTGQIALLQELDARPAIIEAISTLVGPSMRNATANNAKVVDLATIPSDNEDGMLLVLVNFGSNTATTSFALVALDIKDTPTPVRTIYLHSYVVDPAPKSNWKPKLCLPKSGVAAFVVFEKAVTFVSLGQGQTSTSDAELIAEADEDSGPFQDTIYFQEGADFFACGASVEENKPLRLQRSAIVFLHNFGLVRIRARPESFADSVEGNSAKVTAKSKIEQVVFFGALEASPLDLNRKSDSQFSPDQIETAALEVSREILSSNSPHIPAVAAAMDGHLEQRSKNLEALATYLRHFYPDISRLTKWALRWDAEKLAAAQRVWTACDARRPRNERHLSLLAEAVVSMNEKYKTSLNAERGENDLVRHFFIKDVSEIGTLLGLAWPQLQATSNETGADERLAELMSEANDIIINGLQAAFEFRSASADLYGLEQEPVKEGLLNKEYEGLPEFWTSTPVIWMLLPEQIEYIIEWVSANTTNTPSLEQAKPEMQKLTVDMVQLLDLYCKTSEERCRWALSRPDEQEQEKGYTLLTAYKNHRQELITQLPSLFVDLADDGMTLAEKYSDLNALVGVISIKSTLLVAAMSSTDAKAKAQAAADNRYLDQRIGQYFKKYGDAFAKIMYSEMIKKGMLSTLLDQAAFRGQELTHYLRSNAFAKKVGWINEVLFEKNGLLAAQDLLDVAITKEPQLWNKKVELSISKLVLAANEEASGDSQDEQLQIMSKEQNDALEVVKIQEMAFEHVQPCLHDAVDEKAELQLAMEAYGRASAKSVSLYQLLKAAIERLIRQEAMSADQLIDLLTLMNSSSSEEKQKAGMSLPRISGQEYLLAFKVLKHLSIGRTSQERELLLKIIWRRCYIRDNWQALNKTKNKNDKDATHDLEATTLFKTLYEGYVHDLWDDESGIRILTPREVVGAGTQADEHTDRFRTADLTSRVAKDIAAEDKELSRVMDKFQLEHWAATAKDMAERRWKAQSETNEAQAEKLGSAAEAIYNEDEDLKRGAEKVGWREIVRMGLGF